MKPRGTLMMEHRLIERMFKVIEREITKIKQDGEVDPLFIDSSVDFIRTYADRTHHGKEEDILFRDLEKKEMSKEDDIMMQELVDEHKYARERVAELVDANKEYRDGKKTSSAVVVEKLDDLKNFYPEHIRKEDEIFFPNSEKYFSAGELDAMLEEFREFDKKMIHEKYFKFVEKLEGEK